MLFKKTLIGSIVLSALIAGSSLQASELNVESMNQKLAQLNKDQNDTKVPVLIVIDSQKIGDDMFFVVTGNEKENVYLNVITSGNADIGIVPAQVLPLAGKDKLSAEFKKVDEMFSKIKGRQFAEIYSKIGNADTFYFNGAKASSGGYRVFMVDPKCPHCLDEINIEMVKANDAGEAFAVLPTAAFGEDSADSVTYILNNGSKDNFNDFKKTFLDSPTKSIGSRDEKKRASVLETSKVIFSSSVVTGVPFVFIKK
jgi:hypothetical protein